MPTINGAVNQFPPSSKPIKKIFKKLTGWMERLFCEIDLIGKIFTFSEDRLNQKSIQVD